MVGPRVCQSIVSDAVSQGPLDPRYVKQGMARTTPPVWPADKHISLEEGFHFAACAKRIGKIASIEKKKFVAAGGIDQEQGSGECQAPIFQIWKQLGCVEGLCGSALGMAVKGGFDCTVAWLCSTLVFGGQTVIEAMEHRQKLSDLEARKALDRLGKVQPVDFDCRPPGYEQQESETVVHPKPIPEVVEFIKNSIEAFPNDETLNSCKYSTVWHLPFFIPKEAFLKHPQMRL